MFWPVEDRGGGDFVVVKLGVHLRRTGKPFGVEGNLVVTTRDDRHKCAANLERRFELIFEVIHRARGDEMEHQVGWSIGIRLDTRVRVVAEEAPPVGAGGEGGG